MYCPRAYIEMGEGEVGERGRGGRERRRGRGIEGEETHCWDKACKDNGSTRTGGLERERVRERLLG